MVTDGGIEDMYHQRLPWKKTFVVKATDDA
jgi:hypothetical protein